MNRTEGARLFREAWIAGVHRHFPGDPEPRFITPWEDVPQWEREVAGEVATRVRDLMTLSEGTAARMSREQKARFVAVCWANEVHDQLTDPDPAQVAEWSDLPVWQQETDADIFEAIERSLE
ncbi:hypothetical protein [Streptomyces sp. LaPpAH-108]|uniref:hypothetical protein n=1 Tax=Streptomyces sp. LaPpAH-108 TaxID=1155714 RepID=UPI000561BCBE|nr:hypothetical protein [Streptomyces sp. LaPpAH-108]